MSLANLIDDTELAAPLELDADLDPLMLAIVGPPRARPPLRATASLHARSRTPAQQPQQKDQAVADLYANANQRAIAAMWDEAIAKVNKQFGYTPPMQQEPRP